MSALQRGGRKRFFLCSRCCRIRWTPEWKRISRDICKDLYLRERRRRMTVLLTILKVIGWILLGILGLILLTVLTVLLVPIRYRADGVWKEEKYIRGRVTWLLHLLSICVTYEKELLLEVRVAGFLIYPKKRTIWEKEKSGIRGGCRGRCRRRRRGYECAGCGRSENTVCGHKNAGRARLLPVRLTNRRHKLSRKHLNRSQQTRVARLRPGCLMSNHSQLTRTKRLLRRLTASHRFGRCARTSCRQLFEKLSGKLSQVTDRLRGMQQKTDQLKQQAAYYKRIWDQPQTRQAIGLDFTSWEKLSDMYCRESWRFWNRRDRRSGFYRTDHGDTGNAVSLA